MHLRLQAYSSMQQKGEGSGRLELLRNNKKAQVVHTPDLVHQPTHGGVRATQLWQSL